MQLVGILWNCFYLSRNKSVNKEIEALKQEPISPRPKTYKALACQAVFGGIISYAPGISKKGFKVFEIQLDHVDSLTGAEFME
jgi:hypothetical protein